MPVDHEDPPDLATEVVVLHLKAGPDPMARQGRCERHAAYRLRLLLKETLRKHGFRCVNIQTAKGGGHE